MSSLHSDIGFEVLAQTNQVKVSRFSVRIRLLHWFNAAMILTLYYLGIKQIYELSDMGFFAINDTRSIHFGVGIVWVIGVLSLVVISSIKTSRVKESISTEKLIVKQKVFLVASMILMSLMAITGLSMYWLRPYDMPNLRSVLLLVHDMIAFSYLPILLFHLYLAIAHMESRQSLRTMFRDVYVKYLIHNEVEDLKCYLTDEGGVVFLHARVLQISIVGFQVILPVGDWRNLISLKQLTAVDFVHPELDGPLRMQAKIDYCQQGTCDIFAKFRFTTTVQESSSILLSKAIFFRKLFLSRRTHPRINCNYPVEIKTLGGFYVGILVNLSFGGSGFIIPVKLDDDEELIVSINIKNPEVNFVANGCVVVMDKVSENDWCYGVSFPFLTPEQRLEITKILANVRLCEQHRIRTEY